MVTPYIAKEFVISAFIVACELSSMHHQLMLRIEKYFSISKASFIKPTFSLNVFIPVCAGIYFPRRLLGDYFT